MKFHMLIDEQFAYFRNNGTADEVAFQSFGLAAMAE